MLRSYKAVFKQNRSAIFSWTVQGAKNLTFCFLEKLSGPIPAPSEQNTNLRTSDILKKGFVLLWPAKNFDQGPSAQRWDHRVQLIQSEPCEIPHPRTAEGPQTDPGSFSGSAFSEVLGVHFLRARSEIPRVVKRRRNLKATCPIRHFKALKQ